MRKFLIIQVVPEFRIYALKPKRLRNFRIFVGYRFKLLGPGNDSCNLKPRDGIAAKVAPYALVGRIMA